MCVCVLCVYVCMLLVTLLQGGKEFLLRAHFGLPSVEAGTLMHNLHV